MDAEKWQKIKEIFNRAVEMPAIEAASFLETLTDEYPEILLEVRRLLAAENSGPFGRPLIDLSQLWQDSETIEDLAGRKVAGYRIISELGRGGMGVVFEAERETDDFTQKVALKLLKRGMDSETMLRRFRYERQILASLEHPHIARLLDGGVSADGLPFFAMEYVTGRPLDKYCEEQELGTGERLRLFLQICAAVSFAHSRLVVHRDLKPGNIFVTADGTVKLLDFGIAKIIGAEDEGRRQTVTALGMMTPAYASPEQIRGEIVSTPSDIYSLGLILYELLTGAAPYTFPSNRPDEIARIICESEPPRPSSVISGQWPSLFGKTGAGQPAETANKSRATTPKSRTQKPKALRGDLDNIILKALRKEPERRYASVEQFAGDIERHLTGLPVIARPDTFAYRLEKFLLRHRVPVFAGVLVFLSLVGGIAATSRQAARAEQQRILAEQRFSQVRELANNVVFKYHDEIKDLPGSTHVREILVQDALKYLDNLQTDAAADTALTRELAQAYVRVANVQGGSYQANLGDSAGAAQSFRKAIELLEPLAENSSETKLLAELRDVYTESGRVFFRVGEIDRQTENMRKAVIVSEKIGALEPGNVAAKITHARTLVYWADTLGAGTERKDRTEEKIEIFRRALQTTEESLAAEPDNAAGWKVAAVSTHRLQLLFYLKAEIAQKSGQSERAAGLWREALVYAKRSTYTLQKSAEKNPESSIFRRNIEGSKLNQGKIYRELGETETALRLTREALAVQLEIAGKDPRNNEIKLDLKESHEDLALTYIKRGEFENAFSHFHQSVAYNEELLKNDPENFEFWIAKLRGQQVFADALLIKGEKKSAAGIYRYALALAETQAPKKFDDFIGKFIKEINENMEKCLSKA